MLPRDEHTRPRQFSRFKALEGTFVSIGARSHHVSGIIRDISTGGLSFEYIPRAKPLQKIDRIDIVSGDKKFSVKKLPCKKVYELPITDPYYTPVQMYQVGVQFGEINTKHIHKLVHFLSDSA